MSKKRSESDEIAQADLFDEGVGVRQDQDPSPARGGGYLEKCDFPKFQTCESEKKIRRDPRFDELEKIGLPAAWLRIAERVGFDTFLDVWRMISSDETVAHDGGARMPKLRCYSAFSRYQRNRYIRALAAQGMPPSAIQAHLRRNLCEFIDITNIQRISRQTKIKS